MKIGIVTLIYATKFDNYGGTLQNYALSQVLSDMGHEVSTIALYYSKEPFCLYGKIRRKLYCKYGIDVRISKKGIQCAKVEKYQKKRNDNFLQFRSEKIHTDTRWIEKNNFRNLDSEYDLFIVGRDYCLRPSCYECIAKKVKKSDITIADFWGIHRVATEMNDGKGTSLVLIRSEHGKQVFNLIRDKMKWKEVSYEDGVRGNPAEYSSPSRPSQRDTFFGDMANLNFNELASKYAVPTSEAKKIELKRKIKHIIAPIIRNRGGV